MARKKAAKSTVRLRREIAERLIALRTEFVGERGAPELARRLGIPIRTWYNYENGIAIPGQVILQVIELTLVDPMWLLHGRGRMYSRASTPLPAHVESVPHVPIAEMLRRMLEIVEGGSTPQEPATFQRQAHPLSIQDSPARLDPDQR